MIPKIIHYCWFGHNPKPKLAEKCIRSWKKYCPDYEIIEWNEDNFDISSAPLYVRQAYEAKKWAFVTDYVRLQIVYDHGGVYFDTDVEVIKRIDQLLNYKAFFGCEYNGVVNTGLGFGAEKHLPLLDEIMKDYDSISFISESGSFDMTPCPVRNTKILRQHGLTKSNDIQIIEDNIAIFPMEYFCPMDYENRIMRKTKKTYTIHWFSESWKDIRQIKARKKSLLIHLPNRIAISILGEDRYEKIKKRLRKGVKDKSNQSK